MSSKDRPLKIVILGDNTVGKFSLLKSSCSTVEAATIKNVFDYLRKTVKVEGKEYHANFWYVIGDDAYGRVRPLCFTETDCFILCYARDNESSYSNIEHFWVPEVKRYCGAARLLLVETKQDLMGGLPGKKRGGERLRGRIGADKFVQCSAKTGEGLEKVFTESVKIAVAKQKAQNSYKCNIL